jgi:GNAT superfamily N-acetyltransferase
MSAFTFDHIARPSGEHNLTAHAGSDQAGHIWWWCDGTMEVVFVEPEWRRQGLATDLWRRAREITPTLAHSASTTAAGRAWAASLAKAG